MSLAINTMSGVVPINPAPEGPLTLAEFRASREPMTIAALSEALGEDEETFAQGEFGLLYAKSLYVLARDSDYWTIIERTEHSGGLNYVEQTLYFEWYVSEMTTGWTEEGLTELLKEFAICYSLELTSADEMMIALGGHPASNAEERAFLSWFIRTWEEVVEEEDRLRRAGPLAIKALQQLRECLPGSWDCEGVPGGPQAWGAMDVALAVAEGRA